MIKRVIALLLIFLMVGVPAHCQTPYEIGTRAMFYGIYQGWSILGMTEYKTAGGHEEAAILTMLDKNETYFILVYVVPAYWTGAIEPMTKKPWPVNELIGKQKI